jgi:hypothetical protein
VNSPTDCDQLLTRLADGDALPPALAHHARGCDRCAPVVRAEAALPYLPAPPITPGPALREALEGLHAVPARSPLQRATPALLGAGATALGLPFLLGTAAVPGSASWLGAALLGTLSAAGFVLVFHRGAEGLGLPASWRRAYGTAAALGLVVAASLGPHTRQAAAASMAAGRALQGAAAGAVQTAAVVVGARPPVDPLATFGQYASAGVLFSVLVGALMLQGARHTMPVAPRLAGANVGVAAGLAAATGLHLSLDGSSTLRMAVLALPVVVSMVVGSLLGRRTLAP